MALAGSGGTVVTTGSVDDVAEVARCEVLEVGAAEFANPNSFG